MSSPTKKQMRRLEVFMPAVRDYIVGRWWDTQQPVRASFGDSAIRADLALPASSTPSAWWGRAWTASEARRTGQNTTDDWLMRFEYLFEGLGRHGARQPYSYEVVEPWRCPAPARSERRTAESLAAGQGAVNAPLVRRAIELAGMRAAKEWLLDQGYAESEIADTSDKQAWDFEVRRSGQVILYVEAKGMQAPWLAGSAVTVTRNEVENARRHPDSCVLVVASSCVVAEDVDGNPVATAGAVHVEHPWRPDDGILTPQVFTYQPRWPGQQ